MQKPSGHRKVVAPQARIVFIVRASKEGGIKNPPCQRVQEGSQKVLGNSTCSLAVFYVEQVALNRHVSPQQAASILMPGKRWIVNSVSKVHDDLTTNGRVTASKREKELELRASNATRPKGQCVFQRSPCAGHPREVRGVIIMADVRSARDAAAERIEE